MATAEQIKALVRSIKNQDEERFYNIARQVASSASKKGQAKYASDLNDIIAQGLSSFKNKKPTPKIAQPKGELADLMYATYPKQRLSQLMLSEDLRLIIERIIFEQRQRDKLNLHSLSPKSKILLAGEPGTGKTLTASVLASELKIPLFVIKFEGLISKYLGETSAKLRLIFDHINEKRGVYFFDEFDAIGSQRNVDNDVGEARRIVSSFLQFIEQSTSSSLIVAATNHKEAIDNALFRRFDDILIYEKPNEDAIIKFINNLIALHSNLVFNLKCDLIIQNAIGLSYSDIEMSINNAIKWVVLHDEKTINTELLISEFNHRYQ